MVIMPEARTELWSWLNQASKSSLNVRFICGETPNIYSTLHLGRNYMKIATERKADQSEILGMSEHKG